MRHTESKKENGRYMSEYISNNTKDTYRVRIKKKKAVKRYFKQKPQDSWSGYAKIK